MGVGEYVSTRFFYEVQKFGHDKIIDTEVHRALTAEKANANRWLEKADRRAF